MFKTKVDDFLNVVADFNQLVAQQNEEILRLQKKHTTSEAEFNLKHQLLTEKCNSDHASEMASLAK